jgi:hypothetical protein
MMCGGEGEEQMGSFHSTERPPWRIEQPGHAVQYRRHAAKAAARLLHISAAMPKIVATWELCIFMKRERG